jgi:hypothetical protein
MKDYDAYVMDMKALADCFGDEYIVSDIVDCLDHGQLELLQQTMDTRIDRDTPGTWMN